MPTFAQLRTLTRACFGRFFESDLTTGSDDLRGSIFYLLAFLAAPGVAAPFFIGLGSSYQTPGVAGWGWSMIARQLGPDALRLASLNDKTLYLGVAIVASAIISALTWNSLLPDRRDALVLGALPVRGRTIVLARLAALTMFVAVVALAMHALASVSFAVFLSPGSGVGFFLRNVAAHFVSACAASLFVLFAVTAAQGVVLAIVGPRWFSRVSPLLQMALTAAIVAALCVLPTLVQAVRPTFAPGAAAPALPLRLAPPFWFLGIYETILGTPNALSRQFAATGWSALLAAIALTVATYPLAYGRVMRSAIDHVEAPASRGVLIDWLSRVLARDLTARAAARFTLTTFARVERHRFVLATALGAGIAWGTPGWLAFARAPHAPPSTLILSVPFSILFFGSIGLRVAAALPADVRASWIFDADPISWRAARLGLERVLVALGVVPVVVASTLVSWRVWGGATAITHAGFLASVGLLLVQILLWRMRGVPCASPWTPRPGRLRACWPLYLAALILVTSMLPAEERLLLSHPAPAFLLIVLYSAGAWLLRRSAIRRGPAVDDLAPTIVAPGVEAVARPAGGEDASTRSRDLARADVAPTLLVVREGRLTTSLRRARESLADLRADLVWRHELWHLQRDVALASRTIVRRIGFSLFAAATIALGVGSTVAIYTIAYATLLKPVDIPHIDRVVNLYNYWPSASGSLTAFSWPDYQDLREQQRSYDAMTGWSLYGGALAVRGVAVPLRAEAVDGAYFSFVGAAMQFGRPIVARDDTPGAPLTIVLGDTMWRRHFDADSGIVGKTVTIGGQQAAVIGVAAPSVRGVLLPNIHPTDAWIPLAAVRDGGAFAGVLGDNDRDRHGVFLKGRLRPGVTVDAAGTELRTIARRLDIAFPLGRDPRDRRHWEIRAAADIHVHETMTAFAMPLAVVLMISVGLVLLVTCTNLANLTLARGAAIRNAIAVRLALGASRRRLVQQQTVEATLIAVVGCAAAAALTRLLIDLVRRSDGMRLAPGLTMEIDPALTTSSWIVFGLATLLVIAVCGAWPAWRLTAVSLRATLSDASGGGASSGWRGRQWLIAAQVAVSVLLLSAAAVFLGDLAARARPAADFDLDRVAALTIEPSSAQHGTEHLRETLVRLADRVRREPGISTVAIASQLPFDWGTTSWATGRLDDRVAVSTIWASSTIFDVLGTRLTAGHTFDDRAGSSDVVISASAASAIFGTTDVVGRTLVVRTARADPTGIARHIVGVAADLPTMTPSPFFAGVIYQPMTPDTLRIAVLARGTDRAPAPTSVLPAIVHQIDPDLLVIESTTAAIAAGIDDPSSHVIALLAAILGAATLTMAMTGLFGVLSQRVADRRRELGIRGALGAARADIIRLVVADGLRPVAMGFGVGVVAGVLVQLALRPFLARLMPSMTWTMLLPIPPLLVLAALAACYLPARRALAVDPATAIRSL
jgi:predicted permease